ncbi:hypothetical protein N9T29_01475 [Candidatus Pelagibacter sp.]|nr:hypothetical protein [Candidatus Pelagibacter sp.]
MTIKRKKGFKYKKKPTNSIGVILAFIVVISLFSETTRTIPAGSSEYFNKSYKDFSRLSLTLVETKLLDNISKSYKNFEPNDTQTAIIDKRPNNRENIITRLANTFFPQKKRIENLENKTDKDKLITQNQILENPKDIKLNYKYAREQFKAGNINEGVEVIERLSKTYPDNIKIKLDLLSIYKQANLINKALVLIDNIRNNENTTEENLIFVKKLESSFSDSKKQKLAAHQKKSSQSLIAHMNEISKISKSLFQRSITKEYVAKTVASYSQILQNPKDIKLNYKFAKQQFKAGNINEGIETIQRLSKIYPDDIKIKLDLLNLYKQANLINEALVLIDEIKKHKNITEQELEFISQIESTFNFVHGEQKKKSKWMLSANVSLGVNQDNNVSGVTKNRLQNSSDGVSPFNDALYDHSTTSGLGVTAFRFLGKKSSLMMNASVGNSKQDQGTSDYQNYGLTLALNTYLGNQNLSPYLMLSKYDNKHSAEMLSGLFGLDVSFPAGERHKFSYGFSYGDTKYDQNPNYSSYNNLNSLSTSYTLGHQFYKNEIISTSSSFAFSDSDVVVDAGNDLNSYQLGFTVNFAYPWAYISVSDSVTFSDYNDMDTSINSNLKRSDTVNTFDVSLSKALGDFFPSLDPKKNLTMNIAYEKVHSESNIMNYDYISDNYSLGIVKSFSLN